MPLNTVIFLVVVIGLIISSITDIKKREVPDFLSYSMIAAGLGIRLLYSVLEMNFNFLLYGVLGLILCFLISSLMFYTGQWGGGDAKVLMGLGALIGFELNIGSFVIGMLINILLIGAFFGLIWGAVLAIKNKGSFLKEISRLRNQKLRIFESFGFAVFLVLLGLGLLNPNPFLRIFLILAGVIPIFVVYMWLFAKAVENSCMIKYVSPKSLTEGDWIAEPVMHKGKIIAGPKDLGIEQKQIKQLIGLRIKKVLVKQGIPFIPSFFLGYVATIIFQHFTGIANWLLFFI